MEAIKNAAMYVLGFKSYVMMPFIILILALIFGIKPLKAFKSALTLGVGFVGIFLVFDYFVEMIHPVVEALIERTGLHFNVLDVGWPPMAGITWSFSMAPLLIFLIMGFNVVLLITRATKTVNIDLWNYWHFIFAGAIVYNLTGNILLTVLVVLALSTFTLKMADWSAPAVHRFSGLEGISIPTFSAATYFPVGVLGNKLIDAIPGLNKIEANPEKLKEKLGILSEPMFIGFFTGILLGIGGGYEFRDVASLSVGIAAVSYILPKMCEIVGTALIPISEGMKVFIKKRLPNAGQTYIALDVAVLMGQPSIVVTGILLMPVALILAFLLPGITFIPLGDLANLMVLVSLICPITKGNVLRSFLLGIPIIIANLYLSSFFYAQYNETAASVGYAIAGYDGAFTSLVEGGNMVRVWMIQLFSGSFGALLILPVALVVLYFTRKIALRDHGDK